MQKVDYYKHQVEELEYSLKTLLETGTIIPVELDSKIKHVLSGKSMLDMEKEVFNTV